MTAAAVKRALQQLASPEKAKSSAWFFKTGPGEYGEGDRFIGVTVPEQRKVAKRFRELPLAEVEKLLQSPIHEHRLTALFILVEQYQRVSKKREVRSKKSKATKQSIASFYYTHRAFVNNWDLVDCSAPYILGDYLINHSRGVLYRLARSKSLWERRIAMISCAAFIRIEQCDDALAIAAMLVHDPEDLIQKAVGWMLREIGNRNRAVETGFLDQYAATMPRTMLRYAIEKFPVDLRRQYLRLPRLR